MQVKGKTEIIRQRNRKTGAEFRIVRLNGPELEKLEPPISKESAAYEGEKIRITGFLTECLTHGQSSWLPQMRESFYLMSREMGGCEQCKQLDEQGLRVAGQERKSPVQELDAEGNPIPKAKRQTRSQVAAQHGLTENGDGTIDFGDAPGIEIQTRGPIEVTQLSTDGSETRMRVPANHGSRNRRTVETEAAEPVAAE